VVTECAVIGPLWRIEV